MRLERGVAACYVGLMAIAVLAAYLPIPVWAQMLPSTIMIIYIGAKNTTLKGDDMVVAEQMKTKDAYMFPVIGSVVLFSLYLVFKFLPAEWVNACVKLYFFVFGLLVIGSKISQIASLVLAPSTVAMLTKDKYKLRIPCCKADKQQQSRDASAAVSSTTTAATTTTPSPTTTDSSKDSASTPNNTAATTPAPISVTPTTPADDKLVIEITKLDICAHIVSAGLGAWYLATNHWAASNLFGIGFSIQGIEVISLGSFFNGFILLCGLFFYDIFWVFGTDVMVTVAKSFDAPIKLLFPQHGTDIEGNPLRPSLLGLGDIVIPGIFIALLLRFDIWMNEVAEWKRQQQLAQSSSSTVATDATSSTGTAADTNANSTKTPPVATAPASGPSHAVSTTANAPLPYFHTILIFYFLGLLTTLLVMYKFNAAQPALLYLVPACLISAFGTAIVKGQVKDLWNYKEIGPEESAKDKAE